MSLVTSLFCLVLLLNQRWSPPLRLQVSHCSTFHIICDVPSIAVFCNESIKCLLLLLLLLLLLYDMDVSCHRPFLPGTSLEPAVIPTAQASSFTLQYFPYYVWCSKYNCLLYWIYQMFIIIIIIIIIIIRYGCLLSQAFSAWYFSWTSGDPHRSGLKLHTAVLSVLCVMFQV